MKFIAEDNPRLNKKSNIIGEEDLKKSYRFGKKMIQFIDKNYSNCIGLSAVQVGNPINMFVIRYLGVKKVFINPKIEVSGKHIKMSEGCMSYPNKYLKIIRRDRVTITYFDGLREVSESYEGMLARIIQHEYDHLLGECKVKNGRTVEKGGRRNDDK